jgi:hypothetical protein
MATYAVTTGNLAPETNHTVAAPFWALMTSSGTVFEGGYTSASLFGSPFYATSLPITEPYWMTVAVGGTPLHRRSANGLGNDRARREWRARWALRRNRAETISAS